jgi:hypothetical protein
VLRVFISYWFYFCVYVVVNGTQGLMHGRKTLPLSHIPSLLAGIW